MTRGILQYASANQAGARRRARTVLLVWEILTVLAVPPGVVIGVVGMTAAISERGGEGKILWSGLSVEDRVGFVLWCVYATGFAMAPLVSACLCAWCRWRLNRSDRRGAILAGRLCRWWLGAAAVMAAGTVFGLGEAILHDRWQEMAWWTGLLSAVLIYGMAVEYTRRIMRRV